MKKTHFLEDMTNQHKKDSFVGDIKKNFHNMNEERNNIGQKIQEYSEKGLSKKEILEILSQETFLPVSSIKDMIEEYLFNEEYKDSLKERLIINEIKILKRYFVDKDILEGQKANFLKTEDIKGILLSQRDKMENTNKTYNHTIKLDEDGEIVFTQLKKIVERMEGRKVSNGEFVLIAMLELYSSNPVEEMKNEIAYEEIES